MSIHLYLHLYIFYLPTYLFILTGELLFSMCLYLHLCISNYTYLYISTCLSVCISIYLNTCLRILRLLLARPTTDGQQASATQYIYIYIYICIINILDILDICLYIYRYLYLNIFYLSIYLPRNPAACLRILRGLTREQLYDY